MLQLNPSFDIQALEALVTSEVMDIALTGAEVEAATGREGVTSEGAAIQGADVEKVPNAIDEVAKDAEVAEVAPKVRVN